MESADSVTQDSHATSHDSPSSNQDGQPSPQESQPTHQVSHTSPTSDHHQIAINDSENTTEVHTHGDKEERVSIKNKDEDKDEEEEKRDTEKPLLEDDSVRIDVYDGDMAPDGEGQDTPTLPMPDKRKKKKQLESENTHPERPPMFLFPITRMKLAWNSSSNIVDFLVRATCIFFTSLGWLFCVGGFPFFSIVMMIMGSVYIDDCPCKPEIPIYLIVAGVFGTLQHLFAVWTKYVPRDTESPGSKYRGWCLCVDILLQTFLGIWFICGCVWVYGIYAPDFTKSEYPGEDEKNYCHKTIYLFAFWMLNISFIALALLLSFAFCCVICIATSPKEKIVEQ